MPIRMRFKLAPGMLEVGTYSANSFGGTRKRARLLAKSNLAKATGQPQTPSSDGRRQRSDESRRRIVEAMLEFAREERRSRARKRWRIAPASAGARCFASSR